MDLNRKKVLFIPLEGVLTDGGGLTEFSIRRGLLDRIRQMNVSRVALIVGDSDDADYKVKVKAVEFFVFLYCRTAVSSHHRGNGLVDEVIGDLPHNSRKREHFLSIGERIDKMDYMDLEEFV